MDQNSIKKYPLLFKRISSFFLNFATILPAALIVYYIFPGDSNPYLHELFSLNTLFWFIYFLGTSIEIIFDGSTFGTKMIRIKIIDKTSNDKNRLKNFINNTLFCIIWSASTNNLFYFIILVPIFYFPLVLKSIIEEKKPLFEYMTNTVTVLDVT